MAQTVILPRHLSGRQSIPLLPGLLPVGGQWNFDASNRKAYKGDVPLPLDLSFPRDAIDKDVLALVEQQFPEHIGNLTDFRWGTTAAQAQQALAHFIEQRLPHFGDFQDAMERTPCSTACCRPT